MRRSPGGIINCSRRIWLPATMAPARTRSMTNRSRTSTFSATAKAYSASS